MEEMRIVGGKRLSGTLKIGGAKNSVLPILSATVLLNGKSILHNCPDLSDVTAALGILKSFGNKYDRLGSDIIINSSVPVSCAVPDELMRQMRSSVMFLGSVLGRCKRAVISTPGGCELGPRPIDIHISAISKLGVTVKENKGFIEFSAESGLKGADILLNFPSVGATENIIMAAVLAKGKTNILNAAREPEIKDLADFLNKAGAKITGAGTNTVIIEGVDELSGVEHTVIPDRIEAATYMTAVAVTGGVISLNGVIPEHISAVSSALSRAGCIINTGRDTLNLVAPERLNSVKNIRTQVYPAFPTDAGPMFITAMSVAEGVSVFSENIFKNRFSFIDEMRRFGADIITRGNIAIINGKNCLTAADCKCTDLRGGAALIIAALKAEGESKIGKLCHIKRGYQNITDNLKSIGADISLL